jgi:acyl-CoA reductase-like NAD-dependent aldehyde dehydrogenase
MTPALMAGNVDVLNHASSVPGCPLAIEEIFIQRPSKCASAQALLSLDKHRSL